MILSIYIDGTPRPQPRPRFVGGRVVSTSGIHATLWKERIVASLTIARAKEIRIERAVGLWCTAMFPTPKVERWGTWHTFRPDRDNCEKLVMDALTAAGTIKDDCLICDGAFRKVWAQNGGLSIMLMEPGELPPSDAEDLGAIALDS